MKNYQMYASIMQTPDLLKQCLTDPIQKQLEICAELLMEKQIKRILLTGCGTSYMIAQAAVYFFHAYADIECRCESAFELMLYPNFSLRKDDALIALSHSGGTKAVCDIVKQCRSKGILTIGLSEVADSRLEEASEVFLLGPGGKDCATPKTRSFSTELYMMILLAAELGKKAHRDIDFEEIKGLPQKVKSVLQEMDEPMHLLAKEWLPYTHYVCVGSGTNTITCKEGSLKLLETANVCALSTTIEELAHGNELYLNEQYGVFMIYPDACKGEQRLLQIVEATMLTKAHVCVLTNGQVIPDPCKQIVLSEKTTELLSIFLFILPLQLFSYYLAVLSGANPDQSTAIYEHMRQAIAKFHPPGYH